MKEKIVKLAEAKKELDKLLDSENLGYLRDHTNALIAQRICQIIWEGIQDDYRVCNNLVAVRSRHMMECLMHEGFSFDQAASILDTCLGLGKSYSRGGDE